MNIKIIEIKAKCANPQEIEDILINLNADFRGEDEQIDTYFKCENGRFKLREGEIENSLIFYKRPDQSGPKLSDVKLFKTEPQSLLKEVLTFANGVVKTVHKKRKIFFIQNVKFHIDKVMNIGSFVEIEAIDETGEKTSDELLHQCKFYLQLFKIKDSDLITNSYSDM